MLFIKMLIKKSRYSLDSKSKIIVKLILLINILIIYSNRYSLACFRYNFTTLTSITREISITIRFTLLFLFRLDNFF